MKSLSMLRAILTRRLAVKANQMTAMEVWLQVQINFLSLHRVLFFYYSFIILYSENSGGELSDDELLFHED